MISMLENIDQRWEDVRIDNALQSRGVAYRNESVELTWI